MFKLKRFATVSALAIIAFAQCEYGGTLRILAAGNAPLEPNATFDIVRVDGIPDADFVAPLELGFRATNFAGFSVSEPAGSDNVYDPTQHKITPIWGFGDPGYSPALTPNIPAVWRDTNVAYGKQVVHVFNDGGSYTVTCFAFDDEGNWGTATYTIGASGDAPAIADPDTFFAGNKTICLSLDGEFDEAPDGATECTTVSQVNTAIADRDTAGDTLVRVQFQRGKTYTNLDSLGRRGGNQGVHFGAYGTGARPIIQMTTQNGPFNLRDNDRHSVIMDIDWRGPYDATTETGLRLTIFPENGKFSKYTLIHRSRFSGLAAIDFSTGDSTTNGYVRVFSDTEVTNWQDYGAFIDSQLLFGMIGCDFHQHEDALSGNEHDIANSNFANLTNRHGPIRFNTQSPNVFISCSAFFSRNGWSARDPDAGELTPPTACQPAFRFAVPNTALRCHIVFDRNTFEGGDDMIRLAGVEGNSSSQHRNIVFDKNLFCATSQTGLFLNGVMPGVTVRNAVFYVPAVVINFAAAGNLDNAIKWTYSGTAGSNLGPIEVYGNTYVIAASNAQIGAPTRTLTDIAAGFDSTVENNVFFSSTLSPTIGDGFAPLGSTAISGFAARHKGDRWNFPPVGSFTMGEITISTVRELGAGDWAPGEWIALDYPDYTDKCNGAGDVLAPLTEAQIEGNSGQYHQVSVNNEGIKAMAPSAAGGDGLVTFDFTPTKIRIRNDTSSTTFSGSSKVWVLLDLRDFLMDFVSGTSIEGVTVPAFVPGSGSDALDAYTTGLRAWDDILGNVRSGSIDTDGTTVAGTDELGAFAA